MQNTNIVILGGGGFIGTNLHKFFLKSGIISTSISRSFQEKLDNQVCADALSIDNIKRYLNSNTILIDLLNTPDLKELDTHKQLIQDLNNFSTKKIVFFSSAAVYGNATLPISENTATNPISQYGQSKISIENIISASKTPFLIFRLSNVYGPQQYPKSKQIIPVFFESVLKNQSPTINNNGQQIRDYIYIDDVVKITNSTILKQTGTYNLSKNIGISLNDLWGKISTLTQTKIQPKYTQNNFSEIHTSILNNQKISSVINYQFTSLDQGLTKTWNWLKNLIL